MGSRYGQFSFEERCRIAELCRAGCSIRQVAADLDRSPSSVSRELRRNAAAGSPPAGYRPQWAQQQTRARRWSGSRLERDAELRRTVLEKLAQGWSPAQVCGRLKREQGRPVIGCETIYRFIYAQLKRTNDGAWRRYLPKAKFKRGRRRGKGGSPALLIRDRLPIALRPAEADDRRQPGHWEADFMLFSRYGQSVLVVHERTSRLTALVKTPSRKAEPTAQTLAELLQPLPPPLRLTLTFDNGTEFAEHHRLRRTPGLDTFFCDTHAPWQKGGVENAIGRIRRFLPRRTDLDTLSHDDILAAAKAYNHTPRQCLDYQTPAEVFSQVLHFEWESTSPPPPRRRRGFRPVLLNVDWP
jgi:IS30 family transposase